jgi:putative ABC transport system permease protein
VRRRLAAAQAGVIVALGAGLGLISGILAGWILIRMQQSPPRGAVFISGQSAWDGWRLVLPWRYLLITSIGVPVLAVVIGFLSTRSRLPMLRRLGQ